MIANFFLDNRIGGPHIYSNKIQKNLKNYKFFNVSCGKSSWSDLNLSNIKRKHKFFYFFELIINFFIIIKNKKLKNSNLFFVYSILNFSPVLAGMFLKKRIYWFIIEDVNFLNIFFFKIINYFYKIKVICINKNISKKLNLKKNYQIYPPSIDTKFWRRNKIIKIKKKIIKITLVGNINKIKNYYGFLKFFINSKKKININIIGEKLENQKKYFSFIEKLKFPKSINVIFHGRKDSLFIKKILNNTDVFCLPSLSEGTPIALLESMSMQSICMVSKESNLSKIIKNKYNGFEFRLNEKSFFLTLNKILSLSFSKQIKIRNNARSTVIKNNIKFKL